MLPRADAPTASSSLRLHAGLSALSAEKRASLPTPGVGNIFNLSPLRMCVYGVALTKKDLVQAELSQSRFVWRCSPAGPDL